MIEFQFMVFNRGGELIYESSSPQQSWDGTFKGKDCPSGVYTYTLSYLTLASGEVKQQDFQGKIHLIR
jgi:gliding motility-associated-like protein